MDRQKTAYHYTMMAYKNNSLKDLENALLAFENCEHYRKSTEWNKGLRKGIEKLIQQHKNKTNG